MADLSQISCQLTLTGQELVDLIEAGAIAEQESGWKWPIVSELPKLFTEMMNDLNESVSEI